AVAPRAPTSSSPGTAPGSPTTRRTTARTSSSETTASALPTVGVLESGRAFRARACVVPLRHAASPGPALLDALAHVLGVQLVGVAARRELLQVLEPRVIPRDARTG